MEDSIGEGGRDPQAVEAEIRELTEQIQRRNDSSFEVRALKKQKLQLQIQLAEILESNRVKEVQKDALESGMVLSLKQPTLVAGQECPICFTAFQSHVEQWDDKQGFTFYCCCGKFICVRCINESIELHGSNPRSLLKACPFCRQSSFRPSDRLKQLPVSAERGSAYAQILMAEYSLKMGNEEEAMQWCQRAVEQGSLQAEELLGRIHWVDFEVCGLGESGKKAVAYFSNCARHGYTASQDALGDHHMLHPQNVEMAKKWYTLAAAEGHHHAMFSLSDIYRHEYITGLNRQLPFVLFWAKKATLRGHPNAQDLCAATLTVLSIETYGKDYMCPGFNLMPEVLYWKRKFIAFKQKKFNQFTKFSVESAQQKEAKFVDWYETEMNVACTHCRRPPEADKPLRNCTRCKAVMYCGKECQRKDWELGHKVDCFIPPQQLG